MKHPNYKVEQYNKIKIKRWNKSCFNYWMDMYATKACTKLTNSTLIEAMQRINNG